MHTSLKCGAKPPKLSNKYQQDNTFTGTAMIQSRKKKPKSRTIQHCYLQIHISNTSKAALHAMS